jgi:dTDP-4-amino-4,6-dideoxygalactose transaminase
MTDLPTVSQFMSKDFPINVFVPTFRVEECLAEIRQCLEKGWTGLGYKTVEFEQAWKRYTGLENALFVNSGTAALHLAVALLKSGFDWKDGDEIITTPFTFVSTNQAILYERLKPVFADVDQYLCLDPDSVEERITPRTRAVMFVGYGGSSGQLSRIRALCAKKGLDLILDGAHMSGTRVHGLHAGYDAAVSTFSFHAVKNLPTGDAGMVCFRDSWLDAEARKVSWMGINKDTYNRMSDAGAYKWRYEVEREGWKYNGNSIQAALGLVGLRYLDQDNAYRRQLIRWYGQLFTEADPVRLVPIPPDCEPSGHLCPILTDDRDNLIMYLNSANIFPGVHYQVNTEYPMFKYGLGTCPRAEQASRRVMSLPLHLKMTRLDVERVVTWIREFYWKKS